jgi:hypothetical protein
MHVTRRVHLLSLPLITITWSLASWFPNGLSAASSNEARLTRANNSVQLLHPVAAARRALLNDIAHIFRVPLVKDLDRSLRDLH